LEAALRTWREIAWAVAFGSVFGLLGAGLLLLISSPPKGEAVRLAPPPTPLPLTVHVTGAVASPGVFHLPVGSRVQDALSAAGWYSAEANEQALNLAALIEDGQRLYVPVRSQPAGVGSETEHPTFVAGQSARININSASTVELEALPGIGPALAARIVAFREENGPFPAIEDLVKVPGIGPVKFNGMKHLVSVDDSP
jgi:competence protein ComEA